MSEYRKGPKEEHLPWAEHGELGLSFFRGQRLTKNLARIA